MRLPAIVLAMLSICSLLAAGQTPIYVEPVKDLKPTGTLSTSMYSPVAEEQPYYKKLSRDEVSTGSFLAPYKIHGKAGKYVSWYGIVRGISVSDPQKNEITLLLDQKYFDGMTDSHIMLVSYSGGGDFRATLRADPQSIPPLALVRVYGKVIEEQNKIPHIAVEYMRVWPWLTFTFTDLGGSDASNPVWAKYSKFHEGQRIYNPYPKEDYYQRMLGDPRFFGLNWKPEIEGSKRE
jgi:hypothetical protein